MKLQSTYLSSSGTNILIWMLDDIRSVFDSSDAHLILGDYKTSTHFTSFVVVLGLVFVFLYGVSQLGVDGRYFKPVALMMTCLGVLFISYLLIGAFAGFSILLIAAMVVAIYDLVDPGFGTWSVGERGDKQSVL